MLENVEVHYAGLDGGGTRTRVLLADGQGTIIARGESGSGNYHDIGVDRVSRHFREAFDNAWQELQQQPRPLRAVVFGLASVNTATDRTAIRTGVAGFPELTDANLEVVHDLRIAHAGALGGDCGIVLIVGTGSSVWGLDAHGDCWQSGGWGSLLDDGGSATSLGLQAMIAAIHEHDGRGPKTDLTAAVMDHLQLSELRDLLRIVDHDRLPRQTIAQLAPAVVAAATAGDEAAQQILDRGVAALSQCVVAVHDKLRFDDGFAVAASGGLVESSPLYREALHVQLRRQIPGCIPRDPVSTPAEGALKLALRRSPLD